MDVQEDVVMMNKGKRTKRQRTTASSSSPSAFVLTMGTSSCSSGAGGAGVFLDVSGYNSDHRFIGSPSDSGELAQSSIEEEDMANCLILLARGSGGSQKTAAAAEVYQCKTCDRCFPSFQALGGHRASHKKPPKAVNHLEEKRQEIKSSAIRVINYGDNNTSTALSLQIPGRESGVIGSGNKSRVHECSICGAEFSSGQALGGHMRRHRPLPTAAATAANSSTNEDSSQGVVVKKQRNLLSLDLNLDPAPEPEEYAVFTSKQETIVFTASPLVDCHY